MTLWMILTVLACVASVLVSIPLIRRLETPASEEDRIINVGKDQLAELERDTERELIGKHEAQAAKAEIERRVLAAAKKRSPEYSALSKAGRNWVLAGTLGVVSLGSVGIYAFVGRPELPAQPFIENTNLAASQIAGGGETAPATSAGGVEEMIAGLLAKLENDPGNTEGWRMLGWSYFNTDRYAEAADAYGKSVELDATDPDVLSAYGETLVRAGNGLVSDKSLEAFDAALALNSVDPRARFFKGMALEQRGDPAAAIELWLEIIESAPGNVEWLAGLEGRIQELAASIGYDFGNRLASAETTGDSNQTANNSRPVVTNADISAAQEMTPEDRQAMIVGMVDQLAMHLQENPNDPEGWARLIRSRVVLGERNAAESAFGKATSLFAENPGDLETLTQAVRDLDLQTE